MNLPFLLLKFPEPMTQSLYCHLVCLSLILMLCRINSELGLQAPAHLPVKMQTPLLWDKLSGHYVYVNGVPSSQNDIDTHGE